jgi:hypothetical protein
MKDRDYIVGFYAGDSNLRSEIRKLQDLRTCVQENHGKQVQFIVRRDLCFEKGETVEFWDAKRDKWVIAKVVDLPTTSLPYFTLTLQSPLKSKRLLKSKTTFRTTKCRMKKISQLDAFIEGEEVWWWNERMERWELATVVAVPTENLPFYAVQVIFSLCNAQSPHPPFLPHVPACDSTDVCICVCVGYSLKRASL